MKKVLFIMMSLMNGGAERSLVNLLNELPSDKYNIDLLLFKKSGMFFNQLPENINLIDGGRELEKLYAPISKSGRLIFTKVIGTAISKIKAKGRFKAGYRWKHFYSKKIKPLEGHYDVAISFITGEPLYYLVEKVTADRKITWVHNDYRTANHPKIYDKVYFSALNNIVTISQECAEILKEEFPEYSSKISFIPNISSSTVIKKRAEEFVPAEYKQETTLLSIGRLVHQKGYDVAVQAASILKQKGIQFKWFVIGDGELEKEIKKAIRINNLQNYFILLGVRDNPYPYIKNCDIVVQSSRYEGKSVVLDEAKILGRPIVVTNYPTVKDQIIDCKEGIIVDITPQSVADGIQTLIDDKKLNNNIKEYLSDHEYGNQFELKKYIDLIELG